MSMRIYVACLSSYNAGDLVGDWIDLDDFAGEPDDLAERIDSIIRGEEWAIHDHEGFGPLRIGEHPGLEWLCAVVDAVESVPSCHAPSPMLHWLAYDVPTSADEVESMASRFDDAYRGHWPSWTDYAENYAEDIYHEAHKLMECHSYLSFDYEALSRDLQIEMYGSEGDGGVYIFDTEV